MSYPNPWKGFWQVARETFSNIIGVNLRIKIFFVEQTGNHANVPEIKKIQAVSEKRLYAKRDVAGREEITDFNDGHLANRTPMHRKLRLFFIFVLAVCLQAHAADWMPDAHLEQAIREALEIPDAIPMSPEFLIELHALVAEGGIESLKGIEYATHLKFLHIGRAEVSDLTPLAELENLRVLKLFNNCITDITPLAGLVNLEVLQLQSNQIEDITPLAGLVNLEVLNLGDNPIRDFTPIYGFEIAELRLGDLSISLAPEAFEILNPVDAPEFCEFSSPTYVLPVKERVLNRDYPSVFVSHIDIENRPDLTNLERLVITDFSFGWGPFRTAGHLRFFPTTTGIRRGGESLDDLVSVHREALLANPNMLFLVEIAYFDGRHYHFDEDSPYWLRNADGSIAQRRWSVDYTGKEYYEPLLDFTNTEVQEIIVGQAVAIARCGLYDGIWLDRWHRDLGDHVPYDTEMAARDQILRGIRALVQEDFLIIVNTRAKIPRWAEHVNGIFVETWPRESRVVYTAKDYQFYEEAIVWYEEHLRAPQITLLRGEIKAYMDPMSPVAKRQMRALTALSLTLSDGYITMSTSTPQISIYYDFWDADLGRPIGAKGQPYDNRDGVFIREFTNGWAVYNRSGVAQTVSLPIETTGVSSQRTGTKHTLPDLDGEIYIKSPNVDLNGDGVVNILDLVIVANSFGEKSPDLNSDGVVNILDLVIVANAFGE